MQQDADFITEDFLYMFRASRAHHQEYKMLMMRYIQLQEHQKKYSSVPNMAE